MAPPELKAVAPAAFLAVFSACAGDTPTLVLDVRDRKQFGKGHVAGAFCVRVSADGKVLLVRGVAGKEWQARWRAEGRPPPLRAARRRSAATRTLARPRPPLPPQDYSQSEYDQRGSPDCWWARRVLVYGAPGLKRDHPVLEFLATDGHAAWVGYLREGLPAIEAAHPYLVTSSLKSSAARR